MLADYGDVVPRREFEMMETTCRVSKIIRNAMMLKIIPYKELGS